MIILAAAVCVCFFYSALSLIQMFRIYSIAVPLDCIIRIWLGVLNKMATECIPNKPSHRVVEERFSLLSTEPCISITSKNKTIKHIETLKMYEPSTTIGERGKQIKREDRGEDGVCNNPVLFHRERRQLESCTRTHRQCHYQNVNQEVVLPPLLPFASVR